MNSEPGFDPHGVLRAQEEAAERAEEVDRRADERYTEILDDPDLIGDAVAGWIQDDDNACERYDVLLHEATLPSTNQRTALEYVNRLRMFLQGAARRQAAIDAERSVQADERGD